jgi:AcrR family transcriptional regulator
MTSDVAADLTQSAPPPRQRLLAAGSDLFYRYGIGAVGVDLISDSAGVSKRTLYQQFGSKDELVAECLRAGGADVVAHYLRGATEDAPPRERILGVFDGLAEWSTLDSFRGCPFMNTATELTDPDHPARQVAREFKITLRDFFAGEASRGAATNPTMLADQLLMLFDGAMVQAVMGTAASGSGDRDIVPASMAAASALMDAAHLAPA